MRAIPLAILLLVSTMPVVEADVEEVCLWPCGFDERGNCDDTQKVVFGNGKDGPGETVCEHAGSCRPFGRWVVEIVIREGAGTLRGGLDCSNGGTIVECAVTGEPIAQTSCSGSGAWGGAYCWGQTDDALAGSVTCTDPVDPSAAIVILFEDGQATGEWLKER